MNIEHNVSLKPYNTFHIDCIAAHFVQIKNTEDFLELLQTDIRKKSERKLFLGGGSNILFTQEKFDGLVIYNQILGKEIRKADDGVYVKVGAGENRDEFVRWTIDQGLYGIENLVSIPGTIGAAPIQNIGAYGVEAKDVISNVHGVDMYGTHMMLTNAQCAFGYRDSIFKNTLKNNFFVTDVTFRLQRYASESYIPKTEYGAIQQELAKQGITAPTPRDIATAVASIRATKLPDPKNIGTAGSFFKNIIIDEPTFNVFKTKVETLYPGIEIQFFAVENKHYKIPSGWILDKIMGYRGYRDGDVGCRPEQALCLVNYANATGHDVVHFSEKLQKECMEKLGLQIEPEVNFIS